MDSDLERLHTVSAEFDNYGKVPTIWAASSYLVLCGLFEIGIVVTALNWPSGTVKCDPLYIFLYGHVAFWLITLIVDHYFKWRHHVLYVKGFLEFSEALKKLSSLPFLITSLWNAALLLMLTFYHQKYVELETACILNDLQSPVISAILLFSVEIFFIFVVVINYIYKVKKFNLERHLPDAIEGGRLTPFHSFVSDEVGFKNEGHGFEDLLEKQANLLKFYKNENEILNRKIRDLSSQLRGETIN